VIPVVAARRLAANQKRALTLSLLWAYPSQARPKNFFSLTSHPRDLEVEPLTEFERGGV
jgi:hypothetical protein